ncbi:zinc-ribbon domain-containing protein [Antarcticimicrobium sediminis]|uniref:Thioredoxin n=1 Tax=Antarcticimicrobium sediminis TaxID=2546227 RepID=A0A4R5EXA7_9RHOB|nr:zinc-ribbon domain-containing protein [Antarcticimicrobium sediminis]TDE39645.1 thioredoxin [Antarcticimicrobium sediminis]
MRLTCPNCGAQYEVPDEVIPYEGRDVQCSNCGDTWFQAHPETVAEEDRKRLNAGMYAFDHGLPEPEAENAAENGPESPPEAKPASAPETEPEAEPDLSLPAEGTPEYPSEPQRQELDTAISEILRQEAEREAQLRTTEGAGLESQPELGLASPPVVPTRQVRDTRDTREHMARLRGEETNEAKSDDQPAARSELFPDIEEINSTLRSTGGMPSNADDSALPTGEIAGPRNSGFLRGFSVALVIGAILLLIYANAPRIAQSLPQADPALSTYVAMIDQARYWMDARLGDFVKNVLPE